jgi:hypothetical protein
VEIRACSTTGEKFESQAAGLLRCRLTTVGVKLNSLVLNPLKIGSMRHLLQPVENSISARASAAVRVRTYRSRHGRITSTDEGSSIEVQPLRPRAIFPRSLSITRKNQSISKLAPSNPPSASNGQRRRYLNLKWHVTARQESHVGTLSNGNA